MSTSIERGARLVKLTILIQKLDSISYEEFHRYWRIEHPKIWLSVPIVKSNVVKYSQFHIDENTSKGLKDAGLPIGDFDGGVEIWGKGLGELMQVFQDEEYLRSVVPDEEGFLKRAEAKMLIGWVEDVWADGKEIGREVV